MNEISDVVSSGKSYPLGAAVYPEGVNFSVYSKSCTSMDLLLFDAPDAYKPARVIPLDPRRNRTFNYWHVFVPGVKMGQLYGYRVCGPNDPQLGLRFDGDKVLIDPYARCIAVPPSYSRDAASLPGDNAATSMKSIVVDPAAYDWEGDKPLHRPFSQTVIYEMHVRGFTQDPSSGVSPDIRGTYRGLIEKIPHLKDLGITAVELLPVFQFDEQEAPEGLTNYWGYNPVSFFAPHSGYSTAPGVLCPITEFKDMVKALHRAGIEVILDVVYNHTAESDHTGPTICCRGFENSTYYILEKDKACYANYSGTGNTLNANHSIVRRMILDSLRYWVEEMHVDGFRFDLASILSRDESGQPLANPPVLWEIENDPVLAGTKLIAEAWDAAGLYQVGSFIGQRWKEWNGQFRDDVRSFIIGDSGTVTKIAARFFASPDLYGHEEREAEQSINFVTSHDGFTINDLVSYDEKHNQANLEGNSDGTDFNLSWNCGVEGPSQDSEIERLRVRQIKNLFTINLLALGVPMLVMGDEVRRTQLGNNNAYSQDNEISWFDWNLLERNAEIYRFVKRLISFRFSLDVFKEDHGLSLSQVLKLARVRWHGVKLNEPDWGNDSHSLAFTVRGRRELFHIILNAYWEAMDFELLPVTSGAQTGWRRIVDTSLESPDDFCGFRRAPIIQQMKYPVGPRSVVLLAVERVP